MLYPTFALELINQRKQQECQNVVSLSTSSLGELKMFKSHTYQYSENILHLLHIILCDSAHT